MYNHIVHLVHALPRSVALTTDQVGQCALITYFFLSFFITNLSLRNYSQPRNDTKFLVLSLTSKSHAWEFWKNSPRLNFLEVPADLSTGH